MRVTAEAKLATRRRILDAARDCFSKAGFEAATTRDIAAAAGIAAGTLFNYFPAKEAIAMALVAEALEGGTPPVRGTAARRVARGRPLRPDRRRAAIAPAAPGLPSAGARDGA